MWIDVILLLSPALLEDLQVLKCIYQQGCLDFTSHLITMEEDYSIERVMKEAINELVSLRKIDELLDLLHSMRNLIALPRLGLNLILIP
jgi:hypothetical protein